jgi:hypothetical protein
MNRRKSMASMFNVILGVRKRRAGDQTSAVQQAVQYRREHKSLHSDSTDAGILLHFGNEVRCV